MVGYGGKPHFGHFVKSVDNTNLSMEVLGQSRSGADLLLV